MNDIIAKIAAAYERGHENPLPARTFADVPWNYAALTPEWLTAVLCRNVSGAEVTNFSLGGADDGSTNRRQIRLTYNAAGEAAGLPATIFCKSADQLANRMLVGASGVAEAEVFFYNNLRQRLAIEAPVAYHAAFDRETFSYIVMMQDLSAQVRFCDENSVITRKLAESMVTLLADLHATFHESPELGTPAIPYRGWEAFWDNLMAATPGWDASSAQAIDLMASVTPARLLKRRAEIWPCTDASVRLHRALPKTLLHCDVHLKNWYIASDQRMGLSDWQIMSVGNFARDFIYAIGTALTVEDRRAWGEDLLRLYLERSRENGITPPSYDDALTLIRQQIFTALAFWTVTLCPVPNLPQMQPEATSRVFLERLLTAVDDLDALDSFN